MKRARFPTSSRGADGQDDVMRSVYSMGEQQRKLEGKLQIDEPTLRRLDEK